jgi:hypothetical protein
VEILTVGSALVLTFLLALTLQWAVLAAILRGIQRRTVVPESTSARRDEAS